MPEYVAWELYDERHSPEDISRFISNTLHWPIVADTCDRTWDALTEDKFLADKTMAMGGVAVPETVAVIDRSQRGFGDMPKLSSVEALKEFLTQAELPLFGKVLRGICSFGAFHIEGADESNVYLKTIGAVSYGDFFENMLGKTAYVLQRIVNNHSMLDQVCSATATVRMVSMVRDNDVFFPNAVIKMPGGGNIADAFWRSGNVCSNIDPKTGEFLNITVKDGMEMKRLDAHPDRHSANWPETAPLGCFARNSDSCGTLVHAGEISISGYRNNRQRSRRYRDQHRRRVRSASERSGQGHANGRGFGLFPFQRRYPNLTAWGF